MQEEKRTALTRLVDMIAAQQVAYVALFEAFSEHQPALAQSAAAARAGARSRRRLEALHRSAEAAKVEQPGMSRELRWLATNIEAKLAQRH